MTSSPKTNSPNYKRKPQESTSKKEISFTTSSTPSKSTSSRSTYQIISFSPSESPTPTHVAPPLKLRIIIPMKIEPQEIPSQQTPPLNPHVLTMDNWPSKMDTKNSSFQPQRGACVAEKTNNGAGSIMENMVMDVEEGFWSNKDARTSPIRSVFDVTEGGGVIRSDYYGEDANEDANGSNKLKMMLEDNVLGFDNANLDRRKWERKDIKRTTIMIRKIRETLKERQKMCGIVEGVNTFLLST
nr:hypothetical protein [Tanacetum cinerariifolium]